MSTLGAIIDGIKVWIQWVVPVLILFEVYAIHARLRAMEKRG